MIRVEGVYEPVKTVVEFCVSPQPIKVCPVLYKELELGKVIDAPEEA